MLALRSRVIASEAKQSRSVYRAFARPRLRRFARNDSCRTGPSVSASTPATDQQGKLRPANLAETLIAGLYIATLFGGLESLRQADAPDLPPALACRLRSSGFSGIQPRRGA
jgi:hypothetical protein